MGTEDARDLHEIFIHAQRFLLYVCVETGILAVGWNLEVSGWAVHRDTCDGAHGCSRSGCCEWKRYPCHQGRIFVVELGCSKYSSES
jgi:hypothetical protein